MHGSRQSTFVDDTQTGWDQKLAPVLKGAIDLLFIQGLLPQKATVKLAAGQSAQIGDDGSFGYGITSAGFQTGCT